MSAELCAITSGPLLAIDALETELDAGDADRQALGAPSSSSAAL